MLNSNFPSKEIFHAEVFSYGFFVEGSVPEDGLGARWSLGHDDGLPNAATGRRGKVDIFGAALYGAAVQD